MEIQQEYELVEIDGDVDMLKAHPQNPNRGDVSIVEESVDVNGWYGAVIAQKSTGYILAGHTRLQAARAQGAKYVPVIWRDCDDETALRILLADNETARAATMDEDLVGQILDQLGDIRGTGVRNGSTQPHESDGTASEEQAGVNAAVDALEAGEEAEEALDADSVPDDVYTPQYGVMLVLETEPDQAAVYEAMGAIVEELKGELEGDVKLRVVAV